MAQKLADVVGVHTWGKCVFVNFHDPEGAAFSVQMLNACRYSNYLLEVDDGNSYCFEDLHIGQVGRFCHEANCQSSSGNKD